MDLIPVSCKIARAHIKGVVGALELRLNKMRPEDVDKMKVLFIHMCFRTYINCVVCASEHTQTGVYGVQDIHTIFSSELLLN